MAQLQAVAVEVLCPACGEDQPSPYNGGALWTQADFLKVGGRRPCVSCDLPLIIVPHSRVQFVAAA